MRISLIFFMMCSLLTSSLNTSNNKEEVLSYSHIGESEVDTIYNEHINDNQEIFLKDNYASYYFKNLTENFGNNVYGTCTYVALGMFLSFYDTYWDDNIIPEKYDQASTFTSTKQQGANFELQPYNSKSPGIKYESNSLVSNLSINEYYNIIESKSEEYFQLKLLQFSKSYYGKDKFDGSNGSLGMTYLELTTLLRQYLENYYSADKSKYQILYTSVHSTALIFIKKYVKEGRPVIVRAKNSSNNCHAFVAYDYDEASDEIYVHTGWRRESDNTALTHVSLKSLGYLTILDATGVNFKGEHNHSDNYISSIGNKECSCNYIYPREITILSDNTNDDVPRIQWKSFYKEKWYSDLDLKFELSLINHLGNEVVKYSNITEREYKPNEDDWRYILFQYTNPKFHIKVKLITGSSQIGEYWTKQIFDKSQVKYLPLSHYELAYEPNKWNGDDYLNYNCYAYALNTKKFGGIDPGFSVVRYPTVDKDYLEKSALEQNIAMDAEAYSFTFMSIGKHDICPAGTYKIAIFVSLDILWDYHFYRQNPDRTWSHKPGQQAVTNLDSLNNIIYDPEVCVTKIVASTYDQFIGYYAISPLL